MSFFRCLLLCLSLCVFCAPAPAQQAAAPKTDRELVNVISIFNGAYAYVPRKVEEELGHRSGVISDQLELISKQSKNQYFLGEGKAELYFVLPAQATIESFRLAMKPKYPAVHGYIPRRIEFAVSNDPEVGFEPVAEFELPEPIFTSKGERGYDFRIPVNKKVPGKYIRLSLSGAEKNVYIFSLFSAYGRFNQAAQIRTDFSGVFRAGGKSLNQADKDMTEQKRLKKSDRSPNDPYILLHQKGNRVEGCYIYGFGDGKGSLRVINAISGTFVGAVEGNIFRFTRTSADGKFNQQGSMVLAFPHKSTRSEAAALMAILPMDAVDKEAKIGWFSIYSSDTKNIPLCALKGEREKTAADLMKDSLEKTGTVQLYGVNFDFDSDALRPESSAVLDEVVKVAKANAAWKFEVGGHTDDIGSAPYNQKLSERRAASVVRYLVGKGIAAARLQSKGYGSSRPLVTGTTDSARAQNRRVELKKQ